MKGLDLHRAFFEAHGKPLLLERFPSEFPLLSVGSMGFGSDRFGADDEISRDHCWEPGFQIFSAQLDREKLLGIEKTLYQELPWEFRGFRRSDTPHFVNGIRAWEVDEFFQSMVGSPQPPDSDSAWLRIPETDLFVATNGEVFHDPSGDLTQRREAFSYYPDTVWRFKLAGTAQRISAQRYAMRRALAHGESMAAELALTEGGREAMRLAFLVNRQYAPYDRWLPWGCRQLSDLSPVLMPLIRTSLRLPDLAEKESAFEKVEACCADYIYAHGMAEKRMLWWQDLWREVRGEFAEEPFRSFSHWTGAEDRYGSLFGIGGDIRLLYR